MNGIDLSKPQLTPQAQDSIILKFSLLGCVGLGLIGLFVFVLSGLIASQQNTVKQGKMQTSTKQLEPPLIITKKPQKPIIIEEGSKAYYCIKNNGGTDCLNRDRFAPNYKVVSPPKAEKTYDDYLVQYGVRGDGDCGRWFNGQPNCL